MLQSDREILIVEDSDIDYESTIRAFKKAGIANVVKRCITGDEALDYLFKRGEYEGKGINDPNVILLDLNLPGTDGREVLKQLKADDVLRKIPVIVLTTSNNEDDIDYCYSYGANSYVQKPVDPMEFIKAIQRLKDYWFEIVVLPKNE
ncbi:MAG: response regulator [Coxiellaceae bacterium]|nr:response regulator [Coxiellaceae bacterium]